MQTENAENAACVLALLHRILCLLWFLGSQKVEGKKGIERVTPQNSRGLGDACAVFAWLGCSSILSYIWTQLLLLMMVTSCIVVPVSIMWLKQIIPGFPIATASPCFFAFAFCLLQVGILQDGVEAGLVVKDPDNKIYTGFLQWKHVKDSNCRFLDLIQEWGVVRWKVICRSLLNFIWRQNWSRFFATVLNVLALRVLFSYF